MQIKINIWTCSLLALISSSIPRANTSDAFADDAACHGQVNHDAIEKFFTQINQCLNTNHRLTQHMLMTDEKLYHLQQQLEETQKKLAQLALEQERVPAPVKSHGDNGEIVIQRRQDGSVDFYRTWSEYKEGFGEANGEFFIGLDKLHKLTNSRPYGLLIVMDDWENERRYASYNRFVVGSESEKYELKSLGNYTGTAGDSLSYHLGQKFSTKDQENDKNTLEHCAVWYTGAWWYNACHNCNLNGRYLKGNVDAKEIAQGIHWKEYRGQQYSLKFVEMSLLPSVI